MLEIVWNVSLLHTQSLVSLAFMSDHIASGLYPLPTSLTDSPSIETPHRDVTATIPNPTVRETKFSIFNLSEMAHSQNASPRFDD